MRIVVLVFIVGCNQLYDLDATDPAPSTPPDLDDDTVRDSEDNCPSVANANQGDADADGAGDVCDNCPLIANTSQQDEIDHDGVGDLCDSHPTASGDCLVLFDSFDDPTAFAQHWSASATGTATPAAGSVVLAASSTTAAFEITARDAAGAPLTGTFDVQATFTTDPIPESSSVAVVSNAALPSQPGYRCTLLRNPGASPMAVAYAGLSSATTLPFASEPLRRDLVLRLTTTEADGTPDARCRIDHGIALSFATMSAANVPEIPAGATGVRITRHPLELTAFALYRFQPGTECTQTEYR